MQNKIKWVWEETDPSRSGSSGDIAKLFRHEDPKAPGALAEQMPSAAATLLAREVIQNSWDAARDLQSRVDNTPKFEIEFNFKALVGQEKIDLVRALDITAHAGRAGGLVRTEIGLQAQDCLETITDPSVPLRVLTINESAAAGMYGHWDSGESHMFHALVTVGFTEKRDGSGGSYGYGKAGLIAGSRIRTIAAYSAFLPDETEPDVTRRLLGMTYWGQHKAGDVRYTGFARFGERDKVDPSNVRPFENEVADKVAQTLGFECRDIRSLEELGTSFLVIDPTVDPEELVTAIELSWWPALVEGEFTVLINDYDGKTLFPRPSRNEFLRSFIDAWDLALGKSEPRPKVDRRAEILKTQSRDPLGTLGLTTDTSTWSYADQTDIDDQREQPVDHKSLVALVRGPRMVVEYYPAGQTQPYVRGAFLANDAVDNLLRTTEPKAHDSWRDKSEDGDLSPEAAQIASEILDKIKYQVGQLRKEVKPVIPKADDINLPIYNQIMRRLSSGSGLGIPQPLNEARPISIRMDYSIEASENGLVYVDGDVTYSLSDQVEADSAEVELWVNYKFMEDTRIGDEVELEQKIISRGTFSRESNGAFKGVLRRGEVAKISFTSDTYSRDWTGRLNASGRVIRKIGGEAE